MRHLLSLTLLALALLAHHSVAEAQCRVTVESLTRPSSEHLGVKVQGTASRNCDQVVVHWINPALPDKVINVNVNNSDPDVDNTWSFEYGPADGLTLSMLVNNFACNSDDFELEISCAGDDQCQIILPAEGMRVDCKEGGTSCVIQDVDLNCTGTGDLTAVTSVSGTDGVPLTVRLRVVRDGEEVATVTGTEQDGFLTVTSAFDFEPGDYTVTAEITAPAECATLNTTTFSVPDGFCQPAPDDGGNDDDESDEECATCELCGGDIFCCIAWVLLFIALFVLVAAILYLFCDPSGGGGVGWIVLAVALIAFILALWWIIANCDFDLCTLLQVIVGAITLDLTLVCAVEGLFPCFSAVICGITVIGGIQIRNWFFILIIGMLTMLGIQVLCR